MKGRHTYVRGLVAAGLVLCVLAHSCRRPLFVAGDDYYSAVLHTDWRNYQSYDPDGMTVWFFPVEEEENSYRKTTADVRRLDFYLPSARYTGVVVDYSPDEYSRQEFIGMDRASTALVKATPSGYQPDSVEALFGAGCFHKEFPVVTAATGLYEVTNQPEKMALDTLRNMWVDGGQYGYYIPYEERDTYQENLVVQNFYAYPVSPLWKLRIRIYVTGLEYLYDLTGSIAGLADGRYLALNRTTETPCLVSLEGWDSQRVSKKDGYVSLTIDTFGLPGNLHPVTMMTNPGNETEPRTQMKPSAVIADWAGTEEIADEDVRLNLKFLLRDRVSTVYYHYDVGRRIVSYDDELVLRIDLGQDFEGHPDLPYAEPFNGTGFDADVRPWDDGGEADIPL